jgi:glucose-1-phosphate thymidylyltransferase
MSMQALVLAAGWATRLGDLTGGGPKHLLPIGCRTPIDLVVDRLVAVPSIERVTVITHDVAFPAFVEWAMTRTDRMPVNVISDGTKSLESRLGSIGDMAFFVREMKPDDDLIVVAGDNVFDFDLEPMVQASRHDVVVGLYDVGSFSLASRYGIVEVDNEYTVTGFVEKPDQPISTLAAVAIYGFPRVKLDVIQEFLDGSGNADQSGSLIEWLHTRERVMGHVFGGRWIDIGSTDEYKRAQLEFGG